MMKLETDTPLSDVIKYIKDATQNEAAGLPNDTDHSRGRQDFPEESHALRAYPPVRYR